MKRLCTLLLVLLCVGEVTAKAWRAEWITAPTHSDQPNSWFCFHKQISLSEQLSEPLYADIAVDSKYWLWINGQMVIFEGGLKRGPAPDQTYYDRVDIAPYLKRGENHLAILVWYFGKDGFSHQSSGRAGLLFDCQAESFEILSDASWQGQYYPAYEPTEAPHPNIRLSESNVRFNAQKQWCDWQTKGLDSTDSRVLVVAKAGDAPWNQLVERPIPQWRDFGLKRYPHIEKRVEENEVLYLCSLPYNCHATPYLEVEASAGEMIHIQTDNYLGGGVENVRAEYVTCTGRQSYESLAWMNGHTMIYRIPKSVRVKALRYRETGYDTHLSGHFVCEDDFLNRLREKALRTLYVTMRDTYMDCPDRERAQWWGDEVNELGEAFYATDLRGHLLARKGILELVNWQREDGVLFSPCPSGVWRKELPAQMLASVGYYGFYTYYLYSGDRSIVPQVYDAVRRYLHEVWQLDDQGLLIPRKGDWSWGDWGKHIDLEILLNCWYYLALKAEREFALILDRQDDLRMIEQQMGQMQAHFNDRFWRGGAYRSENYHGQTDDRAQAMAVLAGFAKKEYYPQICEVLQQEYHASPYMEKYVAEALFVMGYPHLALERERQRFAVMVEHPYTTLWEGWGIGKEGYGGGSINHAWSGGTLTLLSQYVAGIAPLKPGFEEFTIRPQLGGLKRVEASVETPRGEIWVKIHQQKRGLEIRFAVPSGTKARLMVGDEERCFESGQHRVVIAQ